MARLKEKPGKDLFVFGSADLSATLIRHRLFDEYRIGLVPITMGEGKPLFKRGAPPLRLELVQSRPFGSRCLLLRYQRPRAEPPVGGSTPRRGRATLFPAISLAAARHEKRPPLAKSISICISAVVSANTDGGAAKSQAVIARCESDFAKRRPAMSAARGIASPLVWNAKLLIAAALGVSL